jgi:acetylcholinesterase
MKVWVVYNTVLPVTTLITDTQAKNMDANTMRTWIQTNFTPSMLPGGGEGALSKAIDAILALYPDVPALGSPYGTGNQTFGLDSNYKRFASFCGSFLSANF